MVVFLSSQWFRTGGHSFVAICNPGLYPPSGVDKIACMRQNIIQACIAERPGQGRYVAQSVQGRAGIMRAPPPLVGVEGEVSIIRDKVAFLSVDDHIEYFELDLVNMGYPSQQRFSTGLERMRCQLRPHSDSPRVPRRRTDLSRECMTIESRFLGVVH